MKSLCHLCLIAGSLRRLYEPSFNGGSGRIATEVLRRFEFVLRFWRRCTVSETTLQAGFLRSGRKTKKEDGKPESAGRIPCEASSRAGAMPNGWFQRIVPRLKGSGAGQAVIASIRLVGSLVQMVNRG
jgi:hypothetical protein